MLDSHKSLKQLALLFSLQIFSLTCLALPLPDLASSQAKAQPAQTTQPAQASGKASDNKISDNKAVKIELGFGKVKIEVDGDKQLQDKLRQLETELLIDEDLATVVTGKNSIQIQLKQDVLKDLPKGFEDLKIEIRSKVEEELKELEAEADSGWVMEQDGRKVVMGSDFSLGKDQYLEELVVIGGSAEIAGRVGSLVILGGDVLIRSTAVIENELEIIGGNVEWESGAQGKLRHQLRGQQNSSSWNIVVDEWDDLPPIKWLQEGVGFWLSRLFKIVVLLALAFVAFRLAPQFHERISNKFIAHGLSGFLWGSLSLVLVLPITLFLAITLLGIPLIPLYYGLLFLFFVLGYLHVARALPALFANVSKTSWLQSPLHKTAAGLVALELIQLIPILGGWVVFMLTTAGFGLISYEFVAQFRRDRNASKVSV